GLVGAEVRMSVSDTYPGVTLYGYNNELFTANNPLDYENRFPTLPSGRSQIPQMSSIRRQYTDRYLSYYGNLAYNYLQRYVLTGSVRWDGSNLFGVKTNQKGRLLW